MLNYTENSSTRFGLRNAALLIIKLTVSGACFWYILRQVNIADVARLADTLDFRWVGIATSVMMLQIPLAGLRWREVVDALGTDGEHTPRGPMIAISAIGIFFGQILPNVAGEAMRVWLLARLDHTWGRGATSVLIDRGVGVFVLLVLGFVIFLFPSDLTALGGHRVVVIQIFGAIVFLGLLGLVLVPRISPILERWRFTRLIGVFARAVHRVFLGSRAGLSILAIALAIHFMTILSIWSLARAQGLALPVLEAAVLFTMIVAMSLLPVSISGWGLREVAVTAFLQSHGIPMERALFFSVSFGLILLVASLPGAIVWAVYSPKPFSKRDRPPLSGPRAKRETG